MRRASLRARHIVGLCFLSVVLCLVAGCGGGGTTGGGGGAPVISQARVITPSGFSRGGGDVTIQAIVTDDSGVSSVAATVTGPGSTTREVTLTATFLTTFLGVFTAPPISTGASEQYTIQVHATDNAGNAATPKTVILIVPNVPPPPPI